MKIAKMTPKRQQLAESVKNHWIGIMDNGIFDEKKAKEGAEWLYGFSKLKKPKVIIVDSPLGAQYAANILSNIGQDVGEDVRQNVEQSVWQDLAQDVDQDVEQIVAQNVWQNVWQNVEQNVAQNVWQNVEQNVRQDVGQKVGENVGQNVGQNVEQNVWQNVGQNVRQSVKQNKLKWFDFSYYGNYTDHSWIAYYDFFDKIGLKMPKKFHEFKQFIESGIFQTIQFEKLIIISKNPEFVKRDENGRMHSTNGPAIRFRDGYQLHYINGVFFESELFEKIKNKELKAKEAILLNNIEQRTIALRELGYENVLAELDAKKIDSYWPANHPHKGEYQLFEVDLKDDNKPALFVRFVDYTTGKSGVLRVNPNELQTRSCMEAIAWTFGHTTKTYNPVVET